VKPARLRPAAENDLTDLTRWYAEKGGNALGARLFDSAHAALEPIQRMPGLGSPLQAESVGITGLRHWGVEGFPVRWFYLERDDHLDVLRLLGERQDIAEILSADEPLPPTV
jgi:toxin ParE1/3/4